MKLKTLKDIEFGDEGGGCQECGYSNTQLQEEAIKWVKDCSGSMKWNKRKDIHRGHCAGCEWFIKFFNITEEDLIKL